jgi:hypothetical protein
MKNFSYSFMLSLLPVNKSESLYSLVPMLLAAIYLAYSMGLEKFCLFLAMMAIFLSVVFFLIDLYLLHIKKNHFDFYFCIYIFTLIVLHLSFIYWLNDFKFYGYLVFSGLVIGMGVFFGLLRKS